MKMSSNEKLTRNIFVLLSDDRFTDMHHGNA